MERHHNKGYNFNSRPNNAGNGSHSSYQHQPGAFVNHHPHPPPHNSRLFKPNEGHNSGTRLNLMHSLRNLLKMQNELVADRANAFQKVGQLRILMRSRISNIGSSLLKDEFFTELISEVKELVKQEKMENYFETQDEVEEGENVSLQENDNGTLRESTGTLDEIKNRWRSRVREVLNGIEEETKVYETRDESITGPIFTRERRVERDFMEFFNEAERQIHENEKKFRTGNDQYGQMITRLRSSEREIAMRDQKIMNMEVALKQVSDKSEKIMAELQQVSADHQFEKLQLYHHVEVCKFNAKIMAMEELLRICKWKRCSCGRDYDDIVREFEGNFHSAYNSTSQECFPVGYAGRFKDIHDRREINCTSSWIFPTGQSHVPPNQPIPINGGFMPSEEAATKGTVLNDLRDRYDELQLKAAVIPNYEEVRTMIMEIVCHFKTGGLRVCEEMRGKQFVSSLFYCNSEDLVPNKTNKIFSTGYGETPEEATLKSVQRALEEIQRMENMNLATGGMEMTFVRRNKINSVLGKLDNEAIRMTLLRSYCNDKVDEKASDDIHCLQEANLYQNHANADEKYMADWKIHIRVEDKEEQGIKEKLKRILRIIKNSHVCDFIDQRSHKR